MNWSCRFKDQITMPDGLIIRTIGGAVEYGISLPKKVRNTEPWQRAAKVLHEAAEHGGPFVFIARIVFCKAVFGETPAPIEARPPLVKAEGFGDAFARADKSSSVNLSVSR
jgi:hypothetical protein